MIRLHAYKLSTGELPDPWILTDDSDIIDKRPGRWTNGGNGWKTRREALEALAEIAGRRGPGQPPIGRVREVRVPDEVWANVVTTASACGESAAEWVRGAIDERLARQV